MSFLYVFTREFRNTIRYIGHTLYELDQRSQKQMAATDDLNTAVAAVASDVTALATLGAQVQASITILQAQAAAGAPNLQPAIDSLTATDTAIKAALAEGASFEGTLPQPAVPPATVTTEAAVKAAPAFKPGS